MKIQSTLLLAVSALFLSLSFAQAEDPSLLFEMRTYHANEGKLDALNARFRDHTIELFDKHRMVNVGYFVPVKNDGNVLIYLLAYPDKASREASWKAFMDDKDWKKAYAKSIADGKLVKKVDSLFLNPTPYSPIFRIEKEDPARIFELRQYTTNKGKLENLDLRFQDHTVNLFEKHGMTNLPYFHIADGQEGAGNTLVYLLAHKDKESRIASFKNFGADPKWKAASTASEVDGKLLIKGGVKSTILVPTDYSPMQ